MNRLSFVSAVAFLVTLSAPATSDEPKGQAIQLNQIWAYNMPKTRDVRELEPDHFGEKTRTLPAEEQIRLLLQSLTEQTQRVLKYPGPRDPDAAKGFAVLGTGLEALRGAYQVLVEKKKPDQAFPEDSQISVVFFSNQSGSYVRLMNVERMNSTIKVQYRFAPLGACPFSS